MNVMSIIRRPSFVAPLALSAVTILAATDCYGPTEVTVTISTDLSCAETVTTGIFKGEYGQYEDTSQAETSACTAAAAGTGSSVGTLVVIPSKNLDGTAAVKVVATRGGKLPRDCDKDASDCIIARRAFAFADHQSRSLSIRLSRDCLGVKCEEKETCVGGPARCVDSMTTCDGSSCLLTGERPEPGGEGGVDGQTPDPKSDGGGLDAGDDASLPVVNGCVSSTGYLVRGSFPGPRRAAASSTTLYWVPNDRRGVVLQVPKIGGREDIAYAPLDVDPKIAAITVDDTALAVAYQVGDTKWVKPTSGTPVVLATSFDIHDIVVAAAPSPRLYVVTQNPNDATEGQVFKLDGTSFDGPLIGGTRVAVDTNNVYVGSNTGVKVLPRSLSSAPASASGAPKNASFALTTNDGVVFGAGNTTSNAIVSFNGTNVAVVWASLAARPTAIGVDQSYVYYGANNGSVYRASRFNGVGSPVVLASEGPSAVIDHLFIDPHPTSGCIYYWVKDSAAATTGRLVIRPKTLN
jgi:hypothetical protein